MKTLMKLVLVQACLSLRYLQMYFIPKSHELAYLLLDLILVTLIKLQCHPEVGGGHLSHGMRFPTICDQQSLRSACTNAQSDQSLC